MAKTAIKINIKEIERMADAIARAASVTESNVSAAIQKFAWLIDRKAKEKIQVGPSRSGREYTRGGKRGRRSAPGEPAKTDTGILAASIRPVFTGRFSAEVGSLDSIAPYGKALEDPNKLNRAWLAPTLEENQGALGDLMTAAINTGGLAS